MQLKQGIYPGLSYEDYDAIDAVRATDLKAYKVSPRRARHMRDNPLVGKHLDLGNAVHTILGEPHLFEQRYVAMEYCVEPIKSGPRKGEPCGCTATWINDGRPLCGKHGSAELHNETRTMLGPSEMRVIRTLSHAVMQRPDIVGIVARPHQTETVIVWDEPDYGVQGKCRIDQWNNDDDLTIVDLKTTSAADLTPATMSKVIHTFGYHNSLGWYRRGCRKLGRSVDHVFLLFLQTVQDMDVAGYWMEEGALDQGEDEMLACLDKYVAAKKTNFYPGVQLDCTHATVGLPEWARADQEVIFDG